MNRLANQFIRLLFGVSLNDTTNAFKAYRRVVIDGCRPLLSPHFNIAVELPLKAIVRGFTWTVVPTTWRNRRFGKAKLKMKEMGSMYGFRNTSVEETTDGSNASATRIACAVLPHVGEVCAILSL